MSNQVVAVHRDMAYTTRGIAYDHQISLATRKDVWLNVRALKAGRTGKLGPDDTAPPVQPTEVEIEEAPEGLERLLWVGMYVPGVQTALDAKFSTSVEGYNGLRQQGKSIAKVPDPVTVPYTEDAFRAGVSKDGQYAKFYALANMANDMCEARLVDQNEVFVFPEYRDDGDELMSQTARIKTWGEKIRLLAKITRGATNAVGAADSGPSRPWQNELAILSRLYLTQYEATHDDMWLDRLETKLKQITTITESTINISRMLSAGPTASFTQTHALLALAEVVENYVDISLANPTLEVEDMILMSRARLALGRAVKPMHYRAWIASFLWSKQQNKAFVDALALNFSSKKDDDDGTASSPVVDDGTLQRVITQIFDNCERVIGPEQISSRPTVPTVDDSKSMSFLCIARDCIKEEITLMKEQVSDVVEVLGPQVSTDGVEEIVAAWPALPDADSLILAMKQALHLSVAGTTEWNRKSVDRLQFIVDQIDIFVKAKEAEGGEDEEM